MPARMPARRHGSGKYRNLSQVRRPVLVKAKLDAGQGLLDDHHDPHRHRHREELNILDYCTYHVLIGFIVLVVVITTVTLALVLSPVQLPDRPNFLFIIADDLGFNDVGYKGEGDIRTPYIDRLARSSIKLERHYTSPMCSPTRAALFTGRYPFRYGMGGSRAIYYGTENGLDLSQTLLPQELKKVGYSTYLIGKWHLGFASWAMTPVRRGFDYFFGTYGGSGTYKTHMSFEGPRTSGYDLFEDVKGDTGNRFVNHSVVKDPEHTFSELLFTEKAIEKIESHKPDAEGNSEPFFMVVSYMNPHAPIKPMREDLLLNSDIKNQKRREMAAMITSLDYGVGRLTATLESTKLFNKTIIIFISDNGGHVMMPDGESLGSSNAPLRGAKCTLYEGGVRTPAFIRIPDIEDESPGNVTMKYTGLFHVSDWFPTIARMSELDMSLLKRLNLDGKDHTDIFKTILAGKEIKTKPRDHIVLDIDPVFNQAALIQDDFKLILGNPAALSFDKVYPLITEDNIKEYPDVIASSTHYQTPPNITSEMRNNSLLQAAYASDPSPCRTLSCMSHTRLLYDLSVDPSESYDISWRFGHITKHMYELLEGYVNDNAPLPRSVFFEDEHPEALTSDGIWTPWINSTGK